MATDPATGNESTIVEAANGVVSRDGKRIERKEFKKDDQELKKLKKGVDEVDESVQKLTKSFKAAGQASKGVQPPGGAKATTGSGTPLPPIFADGFSTQQERAAAAGHLRSGGFGGGSMGGLRGLANQGMGPTLIGASIVSGTVGQFAGQFSARADRGMEYASSADKLNVLFQQMTGMSQMALMNQRKPLQNYRIGGQAGANAMLEFESRTGVQASPQQAKSIEGIRTLTGYSKSTADILADQQALLSPQVANKMFMTLGGVNAYTSGGETKDPLKMRQQIVKAMGLDDPNKTGGMGLGSVDRYRMTQAGIPQEMQDELLQFGQQQQAYKKKGGKGDYDPSNPQHRKFMGIEENYATQQEETERVKGKREEDYMRRQIDNMADLEKSNQRLIEAMGSLEDTLSGLLGKQIGNRNWMKLGGAAMSAVGMGLIATTGWTGVGAGVGAGMVVGGSAIGAASGDPVDAEGSGGSGSTPNSSSANDSNISIPYGYGGKRKKLSDVKSDADFRKVDPRLQNRLLAMFRENPNVGIGDSHRDPAQQEQMFKSRYRRTNKKTKIQWDGSYWEHVSGAAAAPPGRSFHEVGLASDLVGDLKWMNANAGRFGLKHFANVNNEPWHVQLAELPNSRREWEKGGGGIPTDDSAFAVAGESMRTSAPEPEDGEEGDHRGSGFGGGMSSVTLSLLNGMSIADVINGQIGQGASGGSALRGRARRRGGVSTSSGGGSMAGAAVGNGQLTGEQVAVLAYQAGFRGQALIDVVAISKRESSWNTGAYNGDRSTKDDSYGLMQINMLGDMGASRLRQFGISKYEDLLDGATNMRAAYTLSGGGQNLSPWGAYKGESNTYNTNVSEAADVVKAAGLSGDPMPEAGSGGIGPSSFISNTKNNITFSPNIQITGTGNAPDLRRIAKEAIAIMKDELELMNMRSGA